VEKDERKSCHDWCLFFAGSVRFKWVFNIVR